MTEVSREIMVEVHTVKVQIRTNPRRDLFRAMRRSPDYAASATVRWLARTIKRSGRPVAGLPTISVANASPLARNGTAGWVFTAESRVYGTAPLWLTQQLLRNPVMAPDFATAVGFTPPPMN